MAGETFNTWMERGRAHQFANRPADAIPVFRRAAREAPGSALPHFHLGEVWWQLGRAADAIAAWRRAAEVEPAFLPARLALVEAGLHEGEYAIARDAAVAAAALETSDARTRVTRWVAGAAAGEEGALDALVPIIVGNRSLARAPAIARALADAFERGEQAQVRSLVEKLAPRIDEFPLPLVSALVRRGARPGDTLGTRPLKLEDRAASRELAVTLHERSPDLSHRLADAYCALSTALPRPPVPFLWPRRTRGRALRLAWVVPAPGDAAWPRARDAFAQVMHALRGIPFALVVVCCGDPDDTRAALAGSGAPPAVYAGVTLPADADAAKAIAGRDCDVMVDGVGLAADIATMLLAQPARVVWGVDVGVPAHRLPIVARTFAVPAELADAIRAVHDALAGQPEPALTSDELQAAWDKAVELHREGDLPGAAEAYAALLAEQPDFAPALHLAGVVAAAHDDPERAEASFAAALAAQPGFLDARLAAADLAIVSRRYDDAMRIVDEGLALSPFDPALLRMQGRVHARRGDTTAALAIYRDILLRTPADALAHFDHGATLQRAGDPAEASRAYQRALTLKPDLIDADFNLGVIFEQAGNRAAATAAFRHVLAANPRHAAAYTHLGDVLLAAGEIDAWLANFREFERHCPDTLPVAVYALEACQHAGDFERLDRYIDGLRRDAYRARDPQELTDCLESLLYLLLFFDIEQSVGERLAQAYDSAVRRVYGEPFARPGVRRAGPVRIGYLSGDLRNHVMGKMMWQAVQHHDRERFDLFFYASARERDEWTQRFEGVATRFVPLAALDDLAAAREIERDDLDLLVDLSTHTHGSRPGILARKPARVTMTHVASAGTLGIRQIDYKLTDRYADVPESQEFMHERLLAMEGCVYPYRHVEPAPDDTFTRERLGIGPDAFVIGAFVNPLKLSRRCLKLWRDVLARLPGARLAFSPAHPALRSSYLRLLRAADIDASRAVFLPQGRDDAQNQARYRVVDVVLDTMPFGGVNGTLEALDMNVPVVTLVGKRHGERTSYSILANLGVRETIAQTGREYVDIAVRLAQDTAFARGVRAAIAQGMSSSPLVDMKAHARNLEAAYEAAIAAGPVAQSPPPPA